MAVVQAVEGATENHRGVRIGRGYVGIIIGTSRHDFTAKMEF